MPDITGFDRVLQSLLPDIINLRRELHRIPERAWSETKTQAAILSFLERHSCRPQKTGGTGILLDVPLAVAAAGGAAACAPASETPTPSTPPRPRCVAVRADLDALPVTELTGLPFASQHAGIMHACGHDMHMAAVAGLAVVLNALATSAQVSAVQTPAAQASAAPASDRATSPVRATDPQNDGTSVRFIFQPAEEGSAVKADFEDLLRPRSRGRRGAQVMMDEGALNGVDAIVGLHCWPDLPAGTIGVDPKIAMAGNAALYIRIRGKGGHGATPHKTIDPIPVAATLILALQTIASRRSNPSNPFVLSVCSMHAGTTGNVTPDNADLIATLRSSTPGFLDKQMPSMLDDMVQGIVKAFGAEAEMSYTPGLPPVVNDPVLVQQFVKSASRVLGEGKAVVLDEAAMTSEDYAYYAEQVPGVYVKVGVAGPAGCAPLHSPVFSPDESALATAIKAVNAFIYDYLGR